MNKNRLKNKKQIINIKLAFIQLFFREEAYYQ